MSLRAVFLVVLAGCGGGGVNSGLPGNKPLVELTGPELCEFADAVQAYNVELFEPEAVCYALARVNAAEEDDFETACQTVYDACMAAGSGEEPLFDFGGCDATEDPDVPATCPATVREVEDCFTDTLDAFAAYAGNRCASPEETLPEMFSAESCVAIEVCFE